MGETLIAARSGSIVGYHDGYDLLSAGFASYAAAFSSGEYKARVTELETQWQACGLMGLQSIAWLRQFRAKIAWEVMPLEQFSLFYRFVFFISKEPRKKHLKADVAIMAWQLILHGRFRLLDRWCEFIQNKGVGLQVVSEDQWGQVLDFSRNVHEDLSNFDVNGAWSWILDEFVERLREPPWRLQGMDCDDVPSPSTVTATSGLVLPVPMSKLGGKRRSPDIDTVAEQLSHLSSAESLFRQSHMTMPKRHCGEGGIPGSVPLQPLAANASTSASSSVDWMSSQPMELSHAPQVYDPLVLDLPAVQTAGRRVIRTRRSGVSDLFNSTVSDALGLG